MDDKMKDLVIAEVDKIRGNAELVSIKHLFHMAEDNPGEYPEITKIYKAYAQSAGRQQLSKIIHASGTYTRWDSEHSSHGGSTAVWMVKP